jgi:S1-C subfamily serine protease
LYRTKDKSFLKIIITSIITSAIVGTAVLFFAASYVSRYIPDNPVPENRDYYDVPDPQLIAAETSDEVPFVASVAKRVSPGVVGISVLRPGHDGLFDTDMAEKWGIGTGFIVSGDGYILTNHHVAGGRNKKIIVSLSDGREVEGTTVWSESVLDLAIVKVNADRLTEVPLGNSDEITVGEPAIAIGNPLGLQFQRSVTSGVISALDRTIKIETDEGYNYMEDLIQTDASINPGNSGGPLLNQKGEVIGINTVKVASAEGIGFAVPINVAVPVVKSFIEKGGFNEPYLGIFAYDKETIPYLDNIKVNNGIYVVNADKNGPAYKAGIKEGCVIEKVDGKIVDTMIQLRTYIYSKSPGDEITITHLDRQKGKFIDAKVKLGTKPGDGLLTR